MSQKRPSKTLDLPTFKRLRITIDDQKDSDEIKIEGSSSNPQAQSSEQKTSPSLNLHDLTVQCIALLLTGNDLLIKEDVRAANFFSQILRLLGEDKFPENLQLFLIWMHAFLGYANVLVVKLQKETNYPILFSILEDAKPRILILSSIAILTNDTQLKNNIIQLLQNLATYHFGLTLQLIGKNRYHASWHYFRSIEVQMYANWCSNDMALYLLSLNTRNQFITSCFSKGLEITKKPEMPFHFTLSCTLRETLGKPVIFGPQFILDLISEKNEGVSVPVVSVGNSHDQLATTQASEKKSESKDSLVATVPSRSLSFGLSTAAVRPKPKKEPKVFVFPLSSQARDSAAHSLSVPPLLPATLLSSHSPRHKPT